MGRNAHYNGLHESEVETKSANFPGHQSVIFPAPFLGSLRRAKSSHRREENSARIHGFARGAAPGRISGAQPVKSIERAGYGTGVVEDVTLHIVILFKVQATNIECISFLQELLPAPHLQKPVTSIGNPRSSVVFAEHTCGSLDQIKSRNCDGLTA